MYIEIDLASVPPSTVLREPDDFRDFKVVLVGVEGDAHVPTDVLRRLAGARADDPAWTEQLGGMLAHAASKGWIRGSDGAVRAHVESPAPTPRGPGVTPEPS